MTEEGTTVRIETPYGALFIDAGRDEKMSVALRQDEYLNERLLEVARQFVNGESTVLDIGAHVGTFAVPIAAEVERVIAFEPSPENFALLSRNAKENDVPIQAINKALGSEKGSGTLVTRNASNAGANTLIAGGDIPIVTLDSEVAHADFIKMDVEGMELEVLRGAERLLKEARPIVLFEVNLSQLRAHGASPRAIERFFTEHGYQLYVPLERKDGVFAKVASATLLTACIAPRAWLFFGESAPFDLIAIPRERVMQSEHARFATAIREAIANNLSVKVRRIHTWMRRILQ